MCQVWLCAEMIPKESKGSSLPLQVRPHTSEMHIVNTWGFILYTKCVQNKMRITPHHIYALNQQFFVRIVLWPNSLRRPHPRTRFGLKGEYKGYTYIINIIIPNDDDENTTNPTENFGFLFVLAARDGECVHMHVSPCLRPCACVHVCVYVRACACERVYTVHTTTVYLCRRCVWCCGGRWSIRRSFCDVSPPTSRDGQSEGPSVGP